MPGMEPLPEDALELDRQVCFALAVASRGVIGIYRPILEPLGLTHPQYLTMLALWQHAPLPVKEIGHLLQLDSATMSPMLKRLEADGLIERRRSDDDERSVQIHLTQAGVDLRDQALSIPEQVVEALGGDLALLEELHGVLIKVNQAAITSTATS